jgi:cell division protein FtsW (lipid II flippase)
MTRSAGVLTLALAALAVAAGAAFLWSVGALPGMASRNLAAFFMAVPLGWAGRRLASSMHGALVLFGLCTAILGLVLFAGVEMDGVRRWLAVGPLTVQPALILVPLLLAIVASREGRHWRTAILIPLVLVALQPDTATMLALTAGIAAMTAAASQLSPRGWTVRRTLTPIGALGLAVTGLLLAGIQSPPPVAFVEGTIRIAVLSGSVAMILHFLAIALMAAALLSRSGPTGFALAAYFTVAALAAAFWAFPMPIAGAGPSHLLGFGLAVGWLATDSRSDAACQPH